MRYISVLTSFKKRNVHTMVGKKRLKRGLDHFLSQSSMDISSEQDELISETGQRLTSLPIDSIQKSQYQPREEMEPQALEDLASSIRSQGILQPIVVRPTASKDKYELIAGERRWRAAQLLELKEIPAIVRESPDEQTMMFALIENIQRENLNPIEEAQALLKLAEKYTLSHEQVAKAVGKSRATVSNLLRLTKLNPKVKELIKQQQLNIGHAKVLLTLEEPLQTKTAMQVASKQLSVRETENLVQRLLVPAKQLNVKTTTAPDIITLQNKLSDQLGTQVKIQHKNTGKGKLIISYNNLAELDDVFNMLQ